MPRYKDSDLLTIGQAADHFGYSAEYLRTLNAEGGEHYDPLFRRMRIKTDPTWRQAFNSHAHYVYRYADLKEWFRHHQSTPSVRTFNESRGIIVEL